MFYHNCTQATTHTKPGLHTMPGHALAHAAPPLQPCLSYQALCMPQKLPTVCHASTSSSNHHGSSIRTQAAAVNARPSTSSPVSTAKAAAPTESLNKAASHREAPPPKQTQQPDSTDAAWERLSEWIAAAGGCLNKVELGFFEVAPGVSIRGVKARQDFSPGDIVLTLPLQRAFMDRNVREAYPGAPWNVSLALHLLAEVAKGEASEFAPYIKLLPAHQPTPLQMTLPEVEQLVYPAAIAAALEYQDVLNAAWEQLQGSVPYTYEQLSWALTMVQSRSLRMAQLGARVMLPGIDMLNHGGSKLCTGRLALGRAAWSSDGEDAAIHFVAEKHIKKGEQVWWSYGDRGNDDFLMYHGFVLNPNPSEDIILYDSVEHAVIWALAFWHRSVSGTHQSMDNSSYHIDELPMGLADQCPLQQADELAMGQFDGSSWHVHPSSLSHQYDPDSLVQAAKDAATALGLDLHDLVHEAEAVAERLLSHAEAGCGKFKATGTASTVLVSMSDQQDLVHKLQDAAYGAHMVGTGRHVGYNASSSSHSSTTISSSSPRNTGVSSSSNRPRGTSSSNGHESSVHNKNVHSNTDNTISHSSGSSSSYYSRSHHSGSVDHSSSRHTAMTYNSSHSYNDGQDSRHSHTNIGSTMRASSTNYNRSSSSSSGTAASNYYHGSSSSSTAGSSAMRDRNRLDIICKRVTSAVNLQSLDRLLGSRRLHRSDWGAQGADVDMPELVIRSDGMVDVRLVAVVAYMNVLIGDAMGGSSMTGRSDSSVSGALMSVSSIGSAWHSGLSSDQLQAGRMVCTQTTAGNTKDNHVRVTSNNSCSGAKGTYETQSDGSMLQSSLHLKQLVSARAAELLHKIKNPESSRTKLLATSTHIDQGGSRSVSSRTFNQADAGNSRHHSHEEMVGLAAQYRASKQGLLQQLAQ